ncbi:substrate-binding periplasmic protein [Blastopirellula marina]|uniref:Amino acid ABC transporter n=1 Tax=Blastopirellula marina TaxID=124 RepID=A0A2S8GAY2_9BACT|nr:transporter substrate-binding domain-containing protein [Blastopirellula marina]PQO41587.1 amino acid ABC transporter [Blastopirellula marina]
MECIAVKSLFPFWFLACGLLTGLISLGCVSDEATLAESTDENTLTIAISPDIPPYILDNASNGLEVDLMQLAFPDYDLNFVQLPYEELETAIPEKKADVSVGVRQEREGQYDSIDFIAFSNVAIAKKSADIELKKIADLGGYEVMTWQNAYLELGDGFRTMFAPGGVDHANYKEVADQQEQVADFWQADKAVIVIDQNIFNQFSQTLGYSLDDVVVFDLFPAVTNFKVAFADELLCNEFNNRIRQLCLNGDYQKLLDKYGVQLPKTPCDQPDEDN